MFRYFCIMRPPMIGGLPTGKTLIDARAFPKRIYIPEIDRMVWGWVEYEEELTPQEIADYELIMQPKNT